MSRKEEHIHILAENELVERIDDFMFSNRIRGRAEAIRRLVRVGLEHSETPADRPAVVAAE